MSGQSSAHSYAARRGFSSALHRPVCRGCAVLVHDTLMPSRAPCSALALHLSPATPPAASICLAARAAFARTGLFFSTPQSCGVYSP